MNNVLTKSLEHILLMISSRINTIVSLVIKNDHQRITTNSLNNKIISITKSHSFILKDLDYKNIKHEGAILKDLNSAPKFTWKGIEYSPATLLSSNESQNTISITTKFVSSGSLTSQARSNKIEILEGVIEYLKHLNSSDRITPNCEEKGPLYFLLFSFIYTFKSIFRQPSGIIKYLHSLSLFLQYFDYGRLIESELSIVHRDLFSSNILTTKGKKAIIILDWESCVKSDSLYEIALIAWQYKSELPDDDLTSLFKKQAPTYTSQKQLVSLMNFVVLQASATESKRTQMFRDAMSLHTTICKTFIPNFDFPTLTLYEKVISILFWWVAAFNKLFSVDTVSEKPRVLCYHSIDDAGWRFSTPISEFKKQMKWLNNHYSITPLSKIIQKDRVNQIGISFDDAYLDVLVNAKPILKEYSIIPTVFCLGNPDIANRHELDNHLPIMSYSDVRKLKIAGWEIGYHTLTHGNLSLLNTDELTNEIVEGKKLIEKKLGFKINSFAYPKGYYSDKVISIVKSAGFTEAWSVDNGYVFNNQSELLYDRIAVDGKWSMVEFKAAISPLGMTISRLGWQALQLKDQLNHSIRIMYNK